MCGRDWLFQCCTFSTLWCIRPILRKIPPLEIEKQLNEIRRHILSMGASVEQRVKQAVDALAREDIELARKVRKGDIEINEFEIDIEHECLRVLALTHPVASDLRFVMTVLRINSGLERIGDKAKSISKRVIDLGEQPHVDIPPMLMEMADAARTMLSNALSAMANEDIDLAISVRRADDVVDQLQKEMFAWAHSEIPQHPEFTQSYIDILSVARALERIGDQSTNIAEDVIFLVRGDVVRHTQV